MVIGELVKKAWAKTGRYLAVLDAASDYDPLEQQRHWIAELEARIARVEAALPTECENSTTNMPET